MSLGLFQLLAADVALEELHTHLEDMERLLEVSNRDADVCFDHQVPRIRERFKKMQQDVFPAVDR
jgi:hypothetical protein